MTVLVVTGTGTGVGKTIATAALAAAARGLGIDVAVCKPVQTGTAPLAGPGTAPLAGPGTAPLAGPGDDDLAEVRRLAGITHLVSVARYPEPLAPVAAAAAAGLALPSGPQVLDAIRGAERPGRLTLVEGAGGLLVEIAADGVTLRDIAVELAAPVLVVCAAGLGTLNHTALTLEALENRGLACEGVVIGSWPEAPAAAEVSNRATLPGLAPLRAVLPAGAGGLSAEQFAAMSAAAVDADWIGRLV